MKKILFLFLMIVGTMTSTAQSGFSFDVTTIYSYDLETDYKSDAGSYMSSYTFELKDSIFIHTVKEDKIVQIYKIVDYDYAYNKEDNLKTHYFKIKSYQSGAIYHYLVLYYENTDSIVIVLGDSDDFDSGIIMDVETVYDLKR